MAKSSKKGGGVQNRIKSLTLHFEDAFLEDYPNARTFELEKIPVGMYDNAVVGFYAISPGLFGIPVIKHKEIIVVK